MADESIFEAAQTPNSGEPTNSFLDKYVGEGKKYKDVEELAKAYENANNFIPTLKGDLDNMKEFMKVQFGELAQKNASNNQPNSNPDRTNDGGDPNKPRDNQPPAKADEEEVDLNERIRQALNEVTTEDRLKDNARITEDAMIKHFGSKEASVEAVRAKAAELNVGPEWLANSAFNSPAAFFKIMDITPESPRSSNTPSSSSDINPQRLADRNPSVKPGTYAHYDQIRRTDPKRYNTVQLQTQLMADAQRLGDDFFKR